MTSGVTYGAAMFVHPGRSLALQTYESFKVNVRRVVATEEGVPLNIPVVAESARPGTVGFADQLSGAVAPDAASPAEYAAPTVPEGRLPRITG